MPKKTIPSKVAFSQQYVKVPGPFAGQLAHLRSGSQLSGGHLAALVERHSDAGRPAELCKRLILHLHGETRPPRGRRPKGQPALSAIDIIIEGNGTARKPDAADNIPSEIDGVVSQSGDLWILGEHKLLCGDATQPGAYEELLGSERAQLAFTDPPYNVPIGGHVCGLGSIKHREFKMASGEMSPHAFAAFLRTIMRNMASSSVHGAIHYICMDWRQSRSSLLEHVPSIRSF